jgi:AcrR family transcriptional regulator
MRKGEVTRNRILDAAEAAVLEKGFAATSIEELIVVTGITKSGFFYHFKDKNELAKALLHRYIEADERVYDEVFGRARELTEDPLQALLLGLKLLAELMADLPNGHPGCLIATSCYQAQIFNREVREINRDAALRWRERFRVMLDEIRVLYPARERVDVDQLADMVSTVIEGGIVMSKALDEPRSLEQQILVFRSLIKLLFTPSLAGIEQAQAAA